MKKQILTSLAAGLALAVLLCCGTGLAKANHHEQLGHKIEAELAQIEAEALLEQFKELTRHSLKLELERATLEVEAETAQSEEERAELEQHLRRTRMTQERLHHLREETRSRLHHIAEALAHHPREHREEREYGREDAGLEERLHQMKRQIEELREAGKHDRADLLERELEEHLQAHRKRNEHRRREKRGEREDGQADLRQHLEHLRAERRKAMAHLEELTVAARHIEGDGEEPQAKRHRFEERAAEVKAHLGELNEQLEELEHAIKVRHRGEERKRVEREECERDEVREREE